MITFIQKFRCLRRTWNNWDFFFLSEIFFYRNSYSRTLKFVDFSNFNNQKIWGGLLISEKMRSIGYQRDTYV